MCTVFEAVDISPIEHFLQRWLRRKFRQQCPGCFRLLWIIINQIFGLELRIKRNHLSFSLMSQ